MSQGKLNGLIPQTPSQPTNTGFSPTPNQSTIGEFGNTFGQPGPVGTPGGFGSSQSGPGGTPGANSQPVAPAIPQSYTSGSISDQIGPVAPADDGLGNDGVVPADIGLQLDPTTINAGQGHPWQSQIMQAPPGSMQATPGATPIGSDIDYNSITNLGQFPNNVTPTNVGY